MSCVVTGEASVICENIFLKHSVQHDIPQYIIFLYKKQQEHFYVDNMLTCDNWLTPPNMLLFSDFIAHGRKETIICLKFELVLLLLAELPGDTFSNM